MCTCVPELIISHCRNLLINPQNSELLIDQLTDLLGGLREGYDYPYAHKIGDVAKCGR